MWRGPTLYAKMYYPDFAHFILCSPPFTVFFLIRLVLVEGPPHLKENDLGTREALTYSYIGRQYRSPMSSRYGAITVLQNEMPESQYNAQSARDYILETVDLSGLPLLASTSEPKKTP